MVKNIFERELHNLSPYSRMKSSPLLNMVSVLLLNTYARAGFEALPIENPLKAPSCNFMCKIIEFAHLVVHNLQYPSNKYLSNPYHKYVYAHVEFVVPGEVFQPYNAYSNRGSSDTKNKIRSLGGMWRWN